MRLRLTLGFLLLAAVGLWIRGSGSKAPAAAPEPRDVGSGQAAGLVQGATAPASTEPAGFESAPVDLVGEATRVALPSSDLSSRLVESSGASVAGAEVSCTPMLPRFLAPWVGWSRQGWDDVQASSAWARSGADGSFALDLAKEGASAGAPYALWITHASHTPKLIQLGASRSDWSLPASIELEPRSAITIQVVNAAGEPVEGAAVQVLVPVPSDATADRLDPQALRVFQRSLTTDASGVVRSCRLDGAMLFRATLGSARSGVWSGTPADGAVVRLELRETFHASGRVTHAPGASIEGPQRVLAYAVMGGQEHLLASAEVERGAFGPMDLPLVTEDGYHFRLEGWNAEIVDRIIATPLPGADVQVDFEVREGVDLWVLIQNEADEVLTDSEVTVTWNAAGVARTAVGHPREDGYILVRGVPPTIATYTGRAPGYAPNTVGPFQLPEEDNPTSVIVLEKGGVLRGRVLSGGRPVPDFEITRFETAIPLSSVVHTFRNAEDGAFEIADAPLGLVSVIASARGGAPSATVETRVTAGEASEPVVLELETAVRGRGQVVSAATGEPVPDARIQPYLSQYQWALSPWGPSIEVGPDGRFDGPHFARGRARIRFTAPGYGTVWQETFATGADELDFGLVVLPERRALEVQLVSEGDFDPAEYYFWAHGAEFLPETRFDGQGQARLEGVSPGVYYARLHRDDGWLLETSVVLESDGDWSIELPTAGPRTLIASVDRRASLPADLWMYAETPLPGGRPIRRVVKVPESGSVEFDGVLPGSFGLALLQGVDWATIGTRDGVIRSEDVELSVVVPVDAEGHSFLVIDGDRRPVPDAAISLIGRDNRSAGGGGSTDEAGTCRILGLSPGSYYAAIQHKDRGTRYQVPVDLGSVGGPPTELSFDPRFAVVVRLVDKDVPLVGVPARLWDERKLYGPPPRASNAEGRIEWGPFDDGDFLVVVDHPGHWLTETKVPSAEPGTVRDVEVRRLGDLVLELKGQGGPVGGQAVEIRSLEFAADVSDWVQSGRVQAGASGCSTDAAGRLRLDGLPHGAYEWSLPGHGGFVQVLPGTVTFTTGLIQ